MQVDSAMHKMMRSGVIKVDRHLCLECRECEVACSLYHEGQCNPNLSRVRVEFDDFFPGLPRVDVCKQCDWPACYYACAALHEEPPMYVDERTGARVIDEARCLGCGACASACPLMPEETVIFQKRLNGRRVYVKCDLCKDRSQGPLCVEVCPPSALTFILAEER